MADKKEQPKKSITQVDLNLAINYMVIERVLRCLGLYEIMCNEHDVIDAVMKDAATFQLKEKLHEYATKDKNMLNILYEKLNGLFDLDMDILFGERQIDLGIKVDSRKSLATRLSKMKTIELDDYIMKKGIEAPMDMDNGSDIEVIDNAVGTKIGNFNASNITNYYQALRQARFNPLGINNAGLFIYLKKFGKKFNIPNHKKLVDEHDKEYTEILWETVFKNIGLYERVIRSETKKEKDAEIEEAPYEYIPKWQDNVYGLDSIIYSVVRKKDLSLFGYTRDGEAKHKALESISELLPYPLVFVRGSELLKLINYINNKGYTIASKYLNLVEFSSIQEEIKHSQEKLNRLSMEGNLSMIKELSMYIDDLQKSLAEFEKNPTKWADDYARQLESQRSSLEKELEELGVTCTDKELKHKKEIPTQINTLNEGIKRSHNRGHQKQPKPIIIVKEPYYEDFTIPEEEYNGGKKRKKATKKK